MSTPLPALIIGAGIAGLPLALQLAKAGKPSIVIERCPGLETKGQNIDLRGPGQEVVARLGLEGAIRAKTTTEKGMSVEDENRKSWAFFGVGEQKEGKKNTSPTSDIEILRGDLADVFYQECLAKYPNLISFRFGAKIASIEENHDSVTLTLKSGEVLHGSILVGADGQGSQVRQMCLASSSNINVRHFHLYMSYYTIPREEHDTDIWRIYITTKRRCLFIRPDGSGKTVRVSLCVMTQDPEAVKAFEEQRDPKVYKEKLKEIFTGAGWEAPRLLKAMDETSDFYLHPTVQIRMDKWHKGRVVLLGDAAWAPSPLGGMGTTLAVSGAYLLAWHLNRKDVGDDPTKAFTRWEEEYRGYVEKAQDIPSFAPGLFYPRNVLEVKALRWFAYMIGVVSKLPFLGSFFGGGEDPFKLPADEERA